MSTVINVTRLPWEEAQFTTEATITIGEEATATDFISACVSAMLIESYSSSVILNGLSNVAESLREDISNNHDYSLGDL